MGRDVARFVTLVAVGTGPSVAYGKAFGPYQTQAAQWLIDAFTVSRRSWGLVNLGTGVAIATEFTVVAALQLGQPGIIAVGALAGVFASGEAARMHDRVSASGLPPPAA